MAVRMCATVALLFALALQGCSFGNADGNEKDTPKEDSGAAAPAELTEIDRVLAGLRKRMTKAEITRAFDARGVDGFPIFYRIADPDWHLNFYGSDSGHVTFV